MNKYKVANFLFLTKRISILYVIFYFLASQNVHAQEVEKIRIVPEQSHGGGVSEYFDMVDYIPLETTKESLFGSIQDLVVTDSSFVIFDADTESLLFFGLDGRFIRKAKIPDRTTPNLLYDNFKKKVVVSLYDRNTATYKRKYFSLNGLAANEEKTKIKNDNVAYMYPLSTDVFALGGGCYIRNNKLTPDDTTTSLLYIYKNDSLHKSFFPFNPRENLGFCALLYGYPSVTAIPGTEAAYVSIPGKYDIYKISADSTQKLFELAFPVERTYPQDLLKSKDRRLVDSVARLNIDGTKIIRGLNNIFVIGDLLLFKLNLKSYLGYQSSDDKYQNNFIYNIKTKRLSSIERINPDSGSHYLPIAGYPWFSLSGLKYGNGFFFSSLSSLQMFQAFQANRAKKIKYPTKLNQYFAGQSRKSNPVIVRMKLKQVE